MSETKGSTYSIDIPAAVPVRRTAVVMASLLSLLIIFVGPASAATDLDKSDPPTGGTVIAQPTSEQRASAMRKLETARLSDPAGFTERMQLLTKAHELVRYLSSVPGFDPELQKEFVAASMPTKALTGLIEITNIGELKIDTVKNSAGQSIVKLTHVKTKTVQMGGGIHASALPMDYAWPQCGAAWAAFWAWFSTQTLLCEALGFFGPWFAFGCYVALGLAGMVIDFNQGC